MAVSLLRYWSQLAVLLHFPTPSSAELAKARIGSSQLPRTSYVLLRSTQAHRAASTAANEPPESVNSVTRVTSPWSDGQRVVVVAPFHQLTTPCNGGSSWSEAST